MIKALYGSTLLLIVTDENVELLRKNRTIHIDLNSMGNPKFDTIVMGWSKTLEEAQENLKPFIGPETRVHGREN